LPVKTIGRAVVKFRLGEAMVELYCIDCGRPINHRGRCLACNMEAQKKVEAQDRYAKKQE